MAALPAAARPLWSQPPEGTGTAAFGGGGAAAIAGVDALFVNPAALTVNSELESEAGMMAFSEGLSPYALFGAPMRADAAYALGYTFDRRGFSSSSGQAHQGLIGGGSWTFAQGMPGDALQSASLGGAVHTQGTESALGVDVDAGAAARAWNWAVFGLSARNLLASGVGQKPEGYRTRASYLASAGWRKASLPIWRFRLYEPDAFYELRAADWPPSGLVHAFSAGTAVMQGGALGLRGTWLLPQSAAPSFAAGLFLRLPVGREVMTFGYAFSSAGANGMPSHAFSLKLEFDGRADKLAPRVAVIADKATVVPGGDAGAGWVHFRVSAEDRDAETPQAERPERLPFKRGEAEVNAIGRLREWTLAICAVDSGGRARDTVRLFQGRDLPPRLIRWDGRGDSGAALPRGYYAYRLSAEDAAGNRGVTAWQLVQVAEAHAPAPDGGTRSETPPAPAGAAADSLDLGTGLPRQNPP